MGMSELDDLTNRVLSLTHKVDSILMTLDVLNINNDRLNETLNIIHNMNFEKSQQNNNIFSVIFPDILRRLCDLEEDLRKKRRKEMNEEIATEMNEEREKLKRIHDMSIHDLELSVRQANCLIAENIYTVGQLLQKKPSDLMYIPNFGRKSLNDLKENLKKMGLELKN